eukprot:4859241-Pleurochrysis_carterae.AAC.1
MGTSPTSAPAPTISAARRESGVSAQGDSTACVLRARRERAYAPLRLPTVTTPASHLTLECNNASAGSDSVLPAVDSATRTSIPPSVVGRLRAT